MNKESINDGKITLTLPDGFRVMTQQEIAGFKAGDSKNNWAAKDEERHLIYNIAWNKVSFLTSGVSIEQLCNNTERKHQKMVPGFTKIQDTKKVVAGQNACGFRYSYKVQDIEMICEYLLFRYEKQNIALIYMGRKGFFDENYGDFETTIATMEIK